MTVKTYLEVKKPANYIITDRVRVPIHEDILTYLDLNMITVFKTEMKKDILYIYTDFSADSC